MSRFNVIAIAGLLTAATLAPAFAHSPRPIQDAQARQRTAIENGRWNGSITKREQRALIAEQERIDVMRRRAQADGNLTGREVRAIRHAQREAQAHINEDRSNRRVNYWRRWKTRNGI